MRSRRRRGGAPVLVLALYLALGSILVGAVTLAATANAAAERDYRRSQARCLAEAGIAEAIAGLAPHGERRLGAGFYAWSEAPAAGGRLVTARGEVIGAGGIRVTRTIRALLARSGARWQVRTWEEGG